MRCFKKSLQSELNVFFGDVPAAAIAGKSAFSQARRKVSDKFFEDFFERTQSAFYAHAAVSRCGGFRLLACDTTVQKLPDTASARELGTHTNQSRTVASVKVATYFDVLNGVVVRAELVPKCRSDLRSVQSRVGELPSDTLSVYDRGFASLLLPFLHTHHGTKYVVRVPVSFNRSAASFLEGPEREVLVREHLSQKCFWELAKLGIRKSQHDTLEYRLVKVPLPGGETEVLMTNLGEGFTVADLGEIYRLRWGVETSYNCIKNTWMLGTFSGYSKKAVVQDIWCALILFNLQTIVQYGCSEGLSAINGRRRACYKVNRNVGAGTLRGKLRGLLFQVGWEALLEWVQSVMLKSLERSKETNKERLRKKLRCNDRHHTEFNYKRGF